MGPAVSRDQLDTDLKYLNIGKEEGANLVRTLGEMYEPAFGSWGQAVFLFGAFAVLYSTFFVATASHARVCADALRVFGVSKADEGSYRFWVRIFFGVLPVLFLVTFAFIPAPKQLVLAGGFMGALMLPLLGVTALYGRYRRGDARLAPSLVWDVFLWFSVAGLFVTARPPVPRFEDRSRLARGTLATVRRRVRAQLQKAGLPARSPPPDRVMCVERCGWMSVRCVLAIRGGFEPGAAFH